MTQLTINVDGRERSRVNSLGDPIDHTDETIEMFWRWFGDSSCIDDIGRPLVVFHGTNAMAYSGGAKIESFHTHNRGGAFFSSSLAIAKEYGESVYKAYLKIDKPLIVNAAGAGWSCIPADSQISAVVTDEIKLAKEKTRREIDAILSELLDEEVVEPVSKKSLNALSLLRDIPGLDGDSVETDIIARAARRFGYSGAIIKNVIDSPTSDKFYSRQATDIYVANSSNCIKSIENYGHWDLDDSSFCRASHLDTANPLNMT